MSPDERDRLVRLFRRRVYTVTGFVPFPHQADWQLASEGIRLLSRPPAPREPSVTVRLGDNRIVSWAVEPRLPAHVLADLAAYKAGKSRSVAMWASGFAAVAGSYGCFVGYEYRSSEHEFNYLLEALLSERGMNMRYDSLQNDPHGGRMRLRLPNGARVECKSWERKQALKGAEVDFYAFCEAYQLPDLSCYTTTAQNLRARRGFAVFTTTADRPWVGILHDYGHGHDPDWYCVCGSDGTVNPFTFDLVSLMRDAPSWELVPESVVPSARARGLEPGLLMTRERFSIAWLGRIGSFVGRVYNYQRGQRLLSRDSHPALWLPARSDLAGGVHVPVS